MESLKHIENKKNIADGLLRIFLVPGRSAAIFEWWHSLAIFYWRFVFGFTVLRGAISDLSTISSPRL